MYQHSMLNWKIIFDFSLSTQQLKEQKKVSDILPLAYLVEEFLVMFGVQMPFIEIQF